MLGRPADRAHDVLVARTAADRTGDRGADLLLAGIRVLVQEGARGHDHPRRAEPALERVALVEALLDGVKPAVDLEVLHRADLVALAHGGQHRARLDRLAVHLDHAGAAVGGVAAPVGARQAEGLAQEVHEQLPRLDLLGSPLPVDHYRHLARSALLSGRTRRRAAQRASRENAGEVALVVDRPTPVGARRAVLGCDLARLGEEVLRRCLAAQELLRAGEVNGRHADRAERDPGVGDPHRRRATGRRTPRRSPSRPRGARPSRARCPRPGAAAGAPRSAARPPPRRSCTAPRGSPPWPRPSRRRGRG